MNTNDQTIHQMGLGISSLVKQATGRESVSNIEMDWVSVEQLSRYIYGSGSGDVVSFETNIQDAIQSLIAYITAVQDTSGGDPSPSNVCPITGWNGCNVTDANMLDSSDPDYDAETYSFTFPDEAGTVYGGTLDVLTGVLTVDKGIVDLGDLDWTYNTSGTQPFMQSSGISSLVDSPSSSSIAAPILCSELLSATAAAIYSGTLTQGIAIHSNGTIRAVYPNMPTDPTDFQTEVDGVQLVYPLKTVATYQLTAQEVTALIGANNIFADTGNVSVQYKVKEDLV